tara:strand:+ start:2511 stop:2735 length:225 start_codon:yes stop_codon:yes gene_type:complete
MKLKDVLLREVLSEAVSKRKLAQQIRREFADKIQSGLLEVWDEVMQSGYGNRDLVGQIDLAEKEFDRLLKFLKV